MDVRDVRHPFAVWFVCVKLSIQQILVFVELLPHLSPFSGTPNLRKQAIFLHDPQDGFGVVVDALPLQPQVHPAIAVGLKAFVLLLCNALGKGCVLLRPAQPTHKAIVSASRYPKETAHRDDRELLVVAMYDRVF